MTKMKKLAAYAAKNAGRYRVAMACALACLAGSVLAEGEPMGVIENFDIATAGTTIRGIMITLIGIIATVYGAALGFVFLRWGYKKITGALKSGG